MAKTIQTSSDDDDDKSQNIRKRQRKRNKFGNNDMQSNECDFKHNNRNDQFFVIQNFSLI